MYFLRPSLIFPITVGFILWLFLLGIEKGVNKKLPNLKLSIISFSIALMALEMGLVFFGVGATWQEKNQGKFISNYTVNNGKPWYHIWTPNSDVKDYRPEFKFDKKSNSLGVVGEEYSLEKDSNEFRIICLGDSFTGGMGAAQDSSVTVFLEKILKEKTQLNINVFNGGVSGGDIFYSYVFLRDKLIQYQPDLVIYFLNDSDLNSDIPIRGGMERFLPDSTVQNKKAPFLEPLFASSRICRLFYYMKDYDELMMKNDNASYQERTKSSIELVGSIGKEYLNLSKGEFDFVLIHHPLIHEIEFSKNWLPKELSKSMNKNKVPFVSLQETFINENIMNAKTAKKFYWPIDSHHNAKGYEAMAKATTIELIKNNFILIEKK